jgi:hypothetical protein
MFDIDVYVAVQHGQNLFVSNRVWDMDGCLVKDSFKLEKPLDEKDEVVISLEDGTVFGIRKQQSINDVEHSYWAIYMAVPPLEYCTMRFAGRGFSDELWSKAMVVSVRINGVEVIPVEK